SGWVSDVRVSPDGNTVAFIDHPLGYDSFGSIAMVDRAGKKTTLSGDFSSARGLAWAPSGKEIWYTASKIHLSSNLFATTLSGQQRLVWAGAGSLVLRDISRDGRVLFVRENRRRGIAGLFPGHTSETDLSWLDWSLPRTSHPTANGSISANKATAREQSIRLICGRRTVRRRYGWATAGRGQFHRTANGLHRLFLESRNSSCCCRRGRAKP